MPQLALKVPVFRRWGKTFFVAVDSHFFRNLPRVSPVDTPANSEVAWLTYPFQRRAVGYDIGEPITTYRTWDDVVNALREGSAPAPEEILDEIAWKRPRLGPVFRV